MRGAPTRQCVVHVGMLVDLARHKQRGQLLDVRLRGLQLLTCCCQLWLEQEAAKYVLQAGGGWASGEV